MRNSRRNPSEARPQCPGPVAPATGQGRCPPPLPPGAASFPPQGGQWQREAITMEPPARMRGGPRQAAGALLTPRPCSNQAGTEQKSPWSRTGRGGNGDTGCGPPSVPERGSQTPLSRPPTSPPRQDFYGLALFSLNFFISITIRQWMKYYELFR